jgi:hypothetical protein
MTITDFLPVYVVGGSIGMIAAILIGLNRALVRASWSNDERLRVVRTASFVLIGWFATSVGLAMAGFYRGVLDQPPTVQYGLLIPIIVGSVLIWRSPLVARVIEAVPQPWLVGVQFYRTLGVIFLILHAAGQVPGLFGLPAGSGDVAIGLTAPLVAAYYARNPGTAGSTVAVWNILGILDLVIAITTGFLTSPSPVQQFAFDAPNELIALYPLVLIPVFLVPVSIVIHIASLTKLARSANAVSHSRSVGMVW